MGVTLPNRRREHMTKTWMAAMLAALLCVACNGPETEPGEPVARMPQTLNLEALGLYLTDNPLAAPPGSLLRADDAVIWREGIVETRRGNRPESTHAHGYGASLTTFGGYVLAHTTDSKLVRRDSSTSTTAYSGTYEAASASQRMRFLEAQGNLYAGTSAGVKRLTSASAAWESAGVPTALEGTGATSGASGFLANNSAVAYRFVFGTRDANGNLHLGAPSGRLLVTNTSGGTRDVALTIPIPSGVDANTYFVQVYRTESRATSSGDPGEEMALVAEVFVSLTDVSNGYVSYTDIATTPNGATAYFSPSQGGIINAKDTPPSPRDMAQFKGYTFYAVECCVQRAQLTLLSVAGSNGLQIDDGIAVRDGATVERFIGAAAENIGASEFQIVTSGTAAQNIEATTRSLVRVINASSTLVTAAYTSAPNDPPGIVTLSSRVVTPDEFQVDAVGSGKMWAPALRSEFIITEAERVADGTVTLSVNSPNFVVSIGDSINLVTSAYPSDFPTGIKTVTNVDNGFVQYSEAGTIVVRANLGTMETLFDELFSSDNVASDTWAYSAFEEPEAVPLGNYFNVASGSVDLYRIVPLSDSLLFWTSGGIYRLSGTDENDFTLRPLDTTVRLIAPDSVVAMANRQWALTEEGVVSATDMGVELVSQPIEKALLELRAAFIAAGKSAEFSAMVHAVAYETEKEYRLWLPSSTSDTYATQCYVYNFNTRTWVRHTTPARAGIVSASEDVQYLSAGASQRFVRERKARNATDYADADGVGVPFSVTYAANVADNPSGSKQWTEVAWLLEPTAPTALGVSLYTEISATPETGTLTTNGLPYVRTYVPVNKARSSVLYVGANHSTAGERASLTGLSVVYTPVSTRLR
jgi:hypothetical protein